MNNCTTHYFAENYCANIDQQPVAGKVMREIVRYETALAYASTMLDSKYFAKINTHKSKEWEEYKKRFCKEKIS